MSSKPLIEIFGWKGQPKLKEDLWQHIAARWPNLTKNTGAVPQSNGVVGIEIEVEGIMRVSTKYDEVFPYLWAVAVDGSLRDRGMEYISTPLSAPYVALALNFLKEYIHVQAAMGYDKPVFSDLCGMHCHLNIRDFSVEQLANLLFLYIVFENSLMRISGERSRNIFCLPINVLTPALRQFLSNVTPKAVQDLVMGTNENQSKYAALNYVPIQKLGTVEFRHMEGNLDVPRLLHWISVILRLRDYAFDADYSKLKERVFDLNSNSEYEKFGREVFDKWFDKINNSTVWNEMAEGVKKLKTLTIPARDIYVADVKEQPKPKERKVFRPDRIGERVRLRMDNPDAARLVAAKEALIKRDERIRRDNPQPEFQKEFFVMPDAHINPPRFVVGGAADAMQWRVNGEDVQINIVDDVVPAPKPEGAF